ncbi:putative Retrovirus-related Pol polyprotein from transposon 17.6 [Hypsibius exemplaris]|uniref:RNA-directed DNA polymerase n=1 Tax=Hypsibius exemplaris TaxID=2072580 RepID=A0A1W0W8T0_HYPEX|nr:putative Retrovirus-related Pol polyprotein from transposon 17.6 [Hypsibius exemplaris]
MPFGLCNSPATFCRLMEEVLGDLKWKTCAVYLDDIQIFSKTFDEHVEHVEEVLRRLENSGISVNQNKVMAVLMSPHPKDAAAVQSFVGNVMYYSKYLPALATVAHPLIKMSQKREIYEWTDAHETSWQTVKTMLTNAPILGHFNPTLELVLETDASTFGLSAVLSQMSDGRPEVLAYASRTLKDAERNYSACELELTAVVWAITDKFHSYVGGSKRFKVVTDHNALVGLLKLKKPKGRLARWVELLRPYHMEVLYRPGRENSVPDFLSRYPYDADDVPTNQVLSGGLTVKSTSYIQQIQEDDVFCRGILKVLRGPTNSPTYRNKILFFIVKGNLLYRMVIRDGRRWFLLVVPQSLQKELIHSAHDDSDHQGITRTYARLHDKYFWKGCLNQVVDYVSSCVFLTPVGKN